MKTATSNSSILRNYYARLVVGVAVVLAVPLIAMQFSSDVDWKPGDFVIIGGLLLALGVLYKVITTKMTDKRQRLVVGAILLVVLVYLWTELAVGVFTNWGS